MTTIENMGRIIAALAHSPLIITLAVLLVTVGAARLAASFIHRGD